jgi:hypothetical protein
VDEINEPLCSVCKTAVAAFDGFIIFLLVLLLFVLIVFLEKKDEFFNTAPDADDDIICSYRVLVFSCSRVRVSSVPVMTEFCVTTTESET